MSFYKYGVKCSSCGYVFNFQSVKEYEEFSNKPDKNHPNCDISDKFLSVDIEPQSGMTYELLEYKKTHPIDTLLPIPMRLICPACCSLHIDEGEFTTKPHHTHACQACGNVWRPAIVATVGVKFLPGFKNS
jgi:rubredoxin